MKELEKSFLGKGQVKGYAFNQISASPNGYLYAITSEVGSIHYEVFKRTENTLYNVVSYPSDKAFGKWAWTTPSLDRAKEILKEIDLKAEKLQPA